jgi:monofunctional biosynthetic peptidoglycan transglycosylase
MATPRKQRVGSGSRKARGGSAKRTGGRVLRVLGILIAIPIIGLAIFWVSLPSIEPLRARFPDSTALIDARADEAKAQGKTARRAQRYVPIAQISPWLQRAVVDSEDARFYLHGSVDEIELKKALDKAMAEHKLGRGASTLTQQLAKNLWLGEQRSVWRKLREAAMADQLEKLGKERILELYLNVVEWGDGIYGAEAAAQRWFGVRARDLAPEQAAILAAMLPAPRKRNPRRPSRKLKHRANEVLELFAEYRQISGPELAAARGRLRSMMGE